MVELGLLEPQGLTKADWEQVFRRLSADLDPWAFDIVELIGRFRAYLAEHDLVLAVPGRMVLASSVLLRLKSDWIRDGGAPPTVGEVAEEVAAQMAEEPAPAYIAPELGLPLRRAPRARTTLGDLNRALSAALASPRRRSAPSSVAPEDLGFDVNRETFTARAFRLFEHLLSLVNGKRVIPFRAMVDGLGPKEQVARFMELLHLDAQGQVRLRQEEFLGEVLIELPHDGQGPG